MMKLQLIYLTLWSVGHAAYISRMAILSNANFGPNRRPTAFRPGVMMRPWHPRYVQAASHRVPYVVYRNSPQRQTVKHYTPTRVFSSPWKATRMPNPAPSTTEYEFVRAASTPTKMHADSGAIHTIPAPNLSLSEKPIVVIDSDNFSNRGVTSESPKITYEVTEKYPDPSQVQVPAKIEQPIGFSKATSLTQPELQSLLGNSAALQLVSELGLSGFTLPQLQQILPQQQSQVLPQQSVQQQVLPQQHVQQQQVSHQQHIQQQQHVITQPNIVPQSIVPQQFTLHSFNNIANTQDMLQAGPEGLVISPNALFQSDPAFLQKLQNQLLQRFPGVEFVPYAADIQQIQIPQAVQSQVIQQVAAPPQSQHPPFFLLQNEQFNRQAPSSFVAAESQTQKSVVQRETQEGNVVTLVPVVNNVTEKQIELTSAAPQNITVELIAAESQPETTTIKYIIETTTEGKSTPVYYAPVEQNVDKADNNANDLQVDQSITNVQVVQSEGNVVTDGFYSAINNVRAAAALAQVDTPQEPTQVQENITTTTINPSSTISAELKALFTQQPTEKDQNTSVTELKPVLGGVPFAKSQNSVNVAYTLHRTDEKEAKVAKDGSVYAGQIVEASISEDHDFNKEKANLLRRPPIRLVAVRDSKNATNSSTTTTVRVPQRVMMVKAKIPQKSKLIFDDKTGEPVLRIYASYVNSPAQKEAVTSKLSNVKHIKEALARKQENVDNWKAATVKALAKPHGFEPNQVTQFGLKLRSRSDDYVPIFDDYEE